MRTGNSIKNSVMAVITNSITILIGFIAQKIFTQTLGSEYLGVNRIIIEYYIDAIYC